MRGSIAGWAAVVVGGALALAASGCGDNSGSLVWYAPEGQPSDAQLLTDVQPVAPGDSSNVLVYGVVYDLSHQDGFRLYVDPNGQGYRPAADYVSAPTTSYATGFNEYRIRSQTVDFAGENDFVARGARHGIESTSSGITLPASIPAAAELIDLARRIDVPLVSPEDSAEVDSTPTLVWSAVPGATRYLLKIEGRNGNSYTAIVTGTTHRVEVDPAYLVNDIPMRRTFLYRWSVEAIDVRNRIFGRTVTTRALIIHS